MKRVFSKISPNKLLYAIIPVKSISDYRMDVSPSEEFLQLSARILEDGTTVAAHKHLPIERVTHITQEAWIVISGAIKGTFYDLDDVELEQVILRDGDAAILFRGGHKLEVLNQATIFYELKTGPYHGKIADKEFIK